MSLTTAAGPFLHPDVVSTVNRTLPQQRVVLGHAALQDPISISSGSLVDMLITECLDHHKNPGLVNWIVDPTKRREAIDHVIKLHGYMRERIGNYVRSEFEELISLYMACLGIPNEPRGSLADVCSNLKAALHRDFGGINKKLNYAARTVNRACFAIRQIANHYSHSPAQSIEDAGMHELCGLFQALGSAMPMIADEFYRPVAPDDPALAAPSTVQAISPYPVNDTRDAAVTCRQLASTQSSVGATASSDGDRDMTDEQSARGCPSVRSQAPLRPPPGFAAITVAINNVPPSARFVPTGADLDKAAAFQLYYNRPRDLPQETDKTRSTMFKRMLNHAKLVPKATLCRFYADHDAACPRSHSYLEVMSYNPLYKLFICRQVDHFDRDDVVEDNVCACIHVNTDTAPSDLLEFVIGVKRTCCLYGAKCKDSNCLRSHSFEETCWYNPSYKTTKCDQQRCSRRSAACLFAHDDERVRDWNSECDYVGKTVRMPFIERTHKALTDALETLRYMRA